MWFSSTLPHDPCTCSEASEGGKQRVLHRDLLLPIGAGVDSSGTKKPRDILGDEIGDWGLPLR